MRFLLWAKTKSVALFTLCFDGTVAVEVNKLRERIKSGKVHFLLQLARFEHTLHVDYRMIRIHVRWITKPLYYLYLPSNKEICNNCRYILRNSYNLCHIPKINEGVKL